MDAYSKIHPDSKVSRLWNLISNNQRLETLTSKLNYAIQNSIYRAPFLHLHLPPAGYACLLWHYGNLTKKSSLGRYHLYTALWRAYRTLLGQPALPPESTLDCVLLHAAGCPDHRTIPLLIWGVGHPYERSRVDHDVYDW